MFHKFTLGVGGGALALLAQNVQAQTAPGNIDDRVRPQIESSSPQNREEALMTGDTDIILLQKSKLFEFTAGLTGSYSSNPRLAPDGSDNDASVQGQLGLRVGTRVADAVDIWAQGSVLGTRYFRETGLDYSALSGEIGLGTELLGVSLTASYQPSLIFNRSFSRRQLTQHGFSLAASKSFRMKRLLITPSLSGERVLSNPSDYRNWSFGGGLSLQASLLKSGRLTAYASGSYQRRIYDDYFTAFVGTKRKDNSWSGAVGLSYRVSSRISGSLSYSYRENGSTSDVNVYQAHGGNLGLAMRAQF